MNKPEPRLRRFADRYRVKITSTGVELVAPGKFGEIVDDYGDGLLHLRLLAVPRDSCRHDAVLRIRRRRAEVAGMMLHQRGGAESIWLFDPANEDDCRLAIELVRPKRKRRVRRASPAALEALRRGREARRMAILEKTPCQGAGQRPASLAVSASPLSSYMPDYPRALKAGRRTMVSLTDGQV